MLFVLSVFQLLRGFVSRFSHISVVNLHFYRLWRKRHSGYRLLGSEIAVHQPLILPKFAGLPNYLSASCFVPWFVLSCLKPLLRSFVGVVLDMVTQCTWFSFSTNLSYVEIQNRLFYLWLISDLEYSCPWYQFCFSENVWWASHPHIEFDRPFVCWDKDWD